MCAFAIYGFFMILYYFFPIICFIVAHVYEFRRGFLFRSALLLSIAVFLCFGYMTGSDWRQYELDYEVIGANEKVRYESGFVIFCKIFFHLGFDYWGFAILAKLLVFVITAYLLKKTCKHFWLSMGLFLSIIAYYMFIDNPLRNFIAASLFWLSVLLLNDRKYFLALLFIFLALEFHISIVLCIPFLLLWFVNLKNRYMLFLLILTYALFSSWSFLSVLTTAGFFLLGFDAERLPLAFIMQDSQYAYGKTFSIGIIALYILFMIIMSYRKKIESESRYGKMILNLALAYLISIRIATTMPVLSRISMSFAPFFCILLGNFVKCLNPNKRYAIAVFLLIYSLWTVKNSITGTYRYVPYTNYLYYAAFEPNLSYRYRAKFNLKHNH